ncbi:MAG TPA: redox-sensing transcriptional repressor Rex [Thermoanaerobaculia bacterium]|nr:redox-sensing transcriptional repressor Rex [Thermoanaerobaculia bacterium]
MSGPNPAAPPLTLNRLSVYLRCLRQLEREGVARVSSRQLADRFHLSSAQIRKDLAHFGEFGVRGVGYEVSSLAGRLHSLLDLDQRHRLVIVGMGNLGSALARYFGFNDDSFEVVAGVDSSPGRVGERVASVLIEPFSELVRVVRDSAAEIGVITVPAEAAEAAYQGLLEAGVRAILNFAPVQLQERPGVRLKNVDMRIHLEEMSYFLGLP